MLKFIHLPATDSSISTMGQNADHLLRRWFQRHGVPVRPGHYILAAPETKATATAQDA
jgi:hypothetical protein